MRRGCSELGAWTQPGQLPLVYSEQFNIRCFGLEKYHPFDSTKFTKVVQGLLDEGLIRREQVQSCAAPVFACTWMDVVATLW